MLLAGVVRSKNSLALFARQAAASIGDFNHYLPIIAPGSKRERAAIRHRIHRIEHQIRQRAVQHIRIGGNRARSLIQFQFAGDRCASRRLQLRLKKL